MVRKAVENRENDILFAAIKIFSEKGYNAATTSEIAKEAGVSEGTIFRYYRSKKELLEKMIVTSAKKISDIVVKERLKKIIEENEGKKSEEILKAIIIDRIDLVEKNKDIFKVVLTELQYHPELRESLIQNMVYAGKDILVKFIENGILKDEFKNINILIALRSLVGMIITYIIQSTFFPDLIKLDKEKQVEEIVNIFLYGIAKGDVCDGK